MLTSAQIISLLLDFDQVTDYARNQLDSQLKKSSGDSYGTIRDRVMESLKGQSSPSTVEAITAVVYIFDPHTPQGISALRQEVSDSYTVFASKFARQTSPTSPNFQAVSGSLQQLSSKYPDRSPHRLALHATTPSLSAELETDPSAGMQKLFTSLSRNSSLPPSDVFSDLSGIVPAVSSSHPGVNDLYSAVHSYFQDQVPALDPDLAASRLVLHKLLQPEASPTETSRFINQNIPVKEDLPSSVFDSVSRFVSGFSTSLNPESDAFLYQSLTAYLIQQGLSPSIAEELAPELAASLKPAFYLVSLSDIPDTSSSGEREKLETEAFSDLSESALDNFDTEQKNKGKIPRSQQTNLSSRDLYSRFKRRYKSPQNIDPVKEFGKNGHDAHLQSYLKYISSRPEAWIKGKTLTSLNKFLSETPVGREISSSGLGKKLIGQVQSALKDPYKNPIKAPFTNPSEFNTWLETHPHTQYGKELISRATAPFKPALESASRTVSATARGVSEKIAGSAAGKAVSATAAKLAGTAVGKAAAATATKVAANAAVQAALQAIGTTIAPILGNIIAFIIGYIVGEILGKIITWLYQQYQKVKEYVKAIAVASAVFISGLLLGTGVAAASLVAGAAGLATFGFTTGFLGVGPGRFFNSFVGHTFRVVVSPMIYAAVASFILISFIIFVITTSSYVVPFNPVDLTRIPLSGISLDDPDGPGVYPTPGGDPLPPIEDPGDPPPPLPIFPPGPGSDYPMCWPLRSRISQSPDCEGGNLTNCDGWTHCVICAESPPDSGNWVFVSFVDPNSRLSNAFDLSTPVGTPVYATHDGNACSYPDADSGWGTHVVIISDLGFSTIYAHLYSATGGCWRATAGQQIGVSGDTGFSTGPHLHYGLSGFGSIRGVIPEVDQNIVNDQIPVGCVADNPPESSFICRWPNYCADREEICLSNRALPDYDLSCGASGQVCCVVATPTPAGGINFCPASPDGYCSPVSCDPDFYPAGQRNCEDGYTCCITTLPML